jgi:hypothetical protein
MLSTDLVADMIRLEQARRLREADRMLRVRGRPVVGMARTPTPVSQSSCDCGAGAA